MTFRQKYEIEYPGSPTGYKRSCPYKYGYCEQSDCVYPNGSCVHDGCERCWNSEIPGTEGIIPEEPSESPVDSRKKRRQKEFDSWAEDMRMMYKALRNAGFDPSEAVTLVNNALLSSAVNNLMGSKRRG